MINVRSVANNVMHFERNVRLVETLPDLWRQHVCKICFGEMKMKFCLFFQFNLKVENN